MMTPSGFFANFESSEVDFLISHRRFRFAYGRPSTSSSIPHSHGHRGVVVHEYYTETFSKHCWVVGRLLWVGCGEVCPRQLPTGVHFVFLLSSSCIFPSLRFIGATASISQVPCNITILTTSMIPFLAIS